MTTKNEKVSKLKATKPELKEEKLKMLVYGDSGVGKTTAAIQFPDAYIFDCEHGTDAYTKTILKSNSVVLHTLNPDDIKDELTLLLTEDHNYKTVIIDPITHIYNSLQDKWSRIFGKHAKSEKEADLQDFGMRYWGRVKQDYKAIQRLLLQLDMNVIVISHQKDIYGAGFNKIGTGADTMKGEAYVYDFVFQLEKRGQQRVAIKIKERAEIGENKFPEEFEWSYPAFLKYYGSVLEKKAEPKKMATKDQIAKIEKLLEIANIPDETVNKWLTKADADEWGQFGYDQLQKCIDYVEKLLKEVR